MRGLVKPCRHSLNRETYVQWRSHLCGLCLTLRDEAGQASRILTGYDVLIPSVLVEAQTSRMPTRTAGPCALRGGLPAKVVRSDAPGMQFAASVALLAGASGLQDKVADRDIPLVTRPAATRVAVAMSKKGDRLAQRSGFDAKVFSTQANAAVAVETGASSNNIDDVLAPTGAAVGAVFAHTAVVAGVEGNAESLRRAGEAYGRLVHLLDAHSDRKDDVKNAHYNPLVAAGMDEKATKNLALRLFNNVQTELRDLQFAQPELITTLLGPVLRRTVDRHFSHGSERFHSHEHRASCNTGIKPAVDTAVAVGVATSSLSGQQYSQTRRGRWRRDRAEMGGSRFVCIPCCCPCDCCDLCCAAQCCAAAGDSDGGCGACDCGGCDV